MIIITRIENFSYFISAPTPKKFIKHDIYLLIKFIFKIFSFREHNSKHIKSKDANNFCLNSGLCYSANNGPRCDCFFTDYEGRRCENSERI